MRLRDRWVRPIAVLLVAMAGIAGSIEPARATDYLTAEQAIARIFPAATGSSKQVVPIDDAAAKAIKSASGVRQRWDEQTVYRVQGADGPLGWLIVDQVVGKHEFITYAAGLTEDGHVQGIDILTYLETYGGEVREDSWRAQFVGKSAGDTLKLGKDVDNISGATLSCRNVTDGVRRLLSLKSLVLDPIAAGAAP